MWRCIHSGSEDFDSRGLPPLTTDLALMISACMVLSSWGGFWSYKVRLFAAGQYLTSQSLASAISIVFSGFLKFGQETTDRVASSCWSSMEFFSEPG